MNSWPDVLCINSYAGSLVLGAKAIGANVVGSYEDAQYGIKIQQANFSDLNYCEFRPEWPDDSLRDTVVIAHPPCSAFSRNNISNSARGIKCMGTTTDAFKCTMNVANYALSLGTPALLIESVPDTMRGAWDVHESLANKYRYTIYRVLQNSCCFGTAQWRPRFWAIFTKRYWPTLRLNYQPNVKTVSEVVDPIRPDYVDEGILKSVALQMEILSQKGITRRHIKNLLSDDENYGYISSVIKRYFDLKEDSYEICRYYFGRWYANHTIRKLPPDGFTSTLLAGQVWFYRGEPLATNRWKAIMGFPPDYVFPGKYAREFRKYLSKGVCPPVAAWLLRNILDQLAGRDLNTTHECAPGEVLDLNVKRSEVEPYWLKKRPYAQPAARKTPKHQPPERQAGQGHVRAKLRYRLVRSAVPRAYESAGTHNAFVVRALGGYQEPLALSELMAELVKLGWQTSSPKPEVIVRWHLQDLRKKHIVEVYR